jgi:hypothetical protein
MRMHDATMPKDIPMSGTKASPAKGWSIDRVVL